MIKKSRMIVAGGLAVVVATAGVAIAGGTGADENNPKVVGKVTPTKLDKKKFKPVNLLLGVINSKGHIDGFQSNPRREHIAISKNVKVNLNKAKKCNADIQNGTPTADAKAMCPRKSVIGSGVGEATLPGGTVLGRPVVTVFNGGPGPADLQLHSYSDETGASSPTIDAQIVNAPGKYGQALLVPAAPQTGAIMITGFKATIGKKTGVATAKCKPKTITYKRTVTYYDNSSETAPLKKQKVKCKRSRR